MELAIGIGVFTFVTLVVAGWRALDTLEAHKRSEADSAAQRRLMRVRPGYTGPRYNAHGNELEN